MDESPGGLSQLFGFLRENIGGNPLYAEAAIILLNHDTSVLKEELILNIRPGFKGRHARPGFVAEGAMHSSAVKTHHQRRP